MPIRPWNRVTGVLFIFTPLCAGCLGAYAYPTAAVVPPVGLEKSTADTVHAFRVEILDTSGSIEFSGSDEYVFREVPVDSRGRLPAQGMVGFGRGWWALLISLNYTQRVHPTLRVRLYRPGYETVELKPWQRPGQIKWKPATTPEAREPAVDDLIATRETNEYYKIAPEAWKNERADYALAAPTKDGQRAALLFVAGEYERLVSDASARGDKHSAERLIEKARQLRTLALE